mmetsp:Transcript_9377/g.16306  ORF Transcript_9377/g.16306 Transcript_9377/m.16306 type:complete len:269 (-) Transcript_9377:126-932(-)
MTSAKHDTQSSLYIAFLFILISACTGFSNLIANRSSKFDAGFLLHRLPRRSVHLTSSMRMGLFDFIQENFLDSRDGDFIPLEQSDDDTPFGPGPLVLLYAVPSTMDDEEFADMVEDGMPRRMKEGDSGVAIRRLAGMDASGEGGDELLNLTVGDALNKVMQTKSSSSVAISGNPIVAMGSTTPVFEDNGQCPVLYFSGVSNREMMDTYGIIANEIYEETSGVHWPACAKVVEPAMEKSLRRVLLDISGDHADAMRMRREEAEKVSDQN